jgi:hypothetical protein
VKAAPITLLLILSPAAAQASSSGDTRPWVGDPVNGKKLYARECAACHGDDGSGGRSGTSLRDSGRLNLITDESFTAIIGSGKGLKRAAEHKFEGKLEFLEIWDVIAHVRTLHLSLASFFPGASRYVAKPYTIDKNGAERMEKATGSAPKELTAPVFTFFTMDGEAGRLAYVPPDPILLDQLKKPNKSGYLVFLPFESEGYQGEAGVAMDQNGKITKIEVHSGKPNADLMNKSLSRFAGLGKKGQKEPFKVAGGKTVDKLAKDVFALYMRAMETATMYDREEAERTWADE